MKKWRRALGVALALGMAFGLCACGKKKGVSTDPMLAKQFVYRMQEFDMSGLQNRDGDGDTYVRSCMEVDGKIYMVVQSYSYNESGSTTLNRLVTVNKDGTNMQVCELQNGKDGKEIREESEPADTDAGDTAGADDAADGAAADSADGTADDAADEGEEPAEAETDELPDIEIAVDEMDNNVYEYVSFSNFQMLGSDRIAGIKNYNYSDYSNPANSVDIQKNYLCAWDLQGKILWETEIDGLRTEDSWSYVNGLAGMKDGSVAVLITGDKAGMRIADEKGKLSPRVSLDDKFSELMDRMSNFSTTADGTIIMTYYDDNWNNMYITSYDLDTNKLGEETKLPASMMYRGLGDLTTDANGDLFFANDQGVFKYHLGDEEPTQLMSYINSDLEINGMNTIQPIDDKSFLGVYSEYDETTYRSNIRGGIFTWVDPADIPDKEVLLVAGNYISGDLRKRAVEFNKTSQTHRIVLKDYSEYQTYEDYNASLTKLNNDIISGNMPDVLLVAGYGGMSLESYINKGLLADIGKLIENDEELSKTEFMDNVFEACKVNGKLYEIIPSFNVYTYIGKTSLVGEREGWTMEEAQALLATMPQGTKLFGDMTNAGFMNVVMEQCGSEFVDISTGKCSFDSPEFIALLEFAKTLPSENDRSDIADDDNDWYMQYESQYRENRTLLASCYIGSFDNMVYTINGSFGEDVSFVGFPGSIGRGGVISANNSYVLSAKSANLDAAWEFMRYYLTEEYQNTLDWQMPVLKKKFDENAQKGMQKPYYEQDGEKVEYDYTYWINNEEIILDPLTQQQVDQIKDFIASVDTRAYYNQDVQNIITEEIEAYFKGDKNVQDTASVIQSRVQIFVNENR